MHTAAMERVYTIIDFTVFSRLTCLFFLFGKLYSSPPVIETGVECNMKTSSCLGRTDGGAEPSPHNPRTALGRADVADGFAGLLRQGAVIALEANPSFQPLHPRAAYEALLTLHVGACARGVLEDCVHVVRLILGTTQPFGSHDVFERSNGRVRCCSRSRHGIGNKQRHQHVHLRRADARKQGGRTHRG